MFLTDSDFRQSVADTLKMNVSALSAYWDRLAVEAHTTAYKDIRGALLARGFSAAQIDAWDRGQEFERDLGLYWALVRGAGLHQYQREFVDALDRREELKAVHVETIAGAPQDPSGSPAKISSGRFDTTDPTTGEEDTWTRSTPL